VGAHEFTPSPEKAPATQPAASGGPPHPPPAPPKLTARDLLEPGEPGRRIFLPDYIELRELAGLLGLKPFRVVAEVMRLGQLKHADEMVDFSTATIIARKHGYRTERIIP